MRTIDIFLLIFSIIAFIGFVFRCICRYEYTYNIEIYGTKFLAKNRYLKNLRRFGTKLCKDTMVGVTISIFTSVYDNIPIGSITLRKTYGDKYDVPTYKNYIKKFDDVIYINDRLCVVYHDNMIGIMSVSDSAIIFLPDMLTEEVFNDMINVFCDNMYTDENLSIRPNYNEVINGIKNLKINLDFLKGML